jgi:hypothetical protein
MHESDKGDTTRSAPPVSGALPGRIARPKPAVFTLQRALRVLTLYWWPRLVATLGQNRGHGLIDHVIWIDAPSDNTEKTIAAARQAFRVR